MTWKKMPALVVPALVLLLAASDGAHADLVTNGGFESNGGNGQLGFNTSATGWVTGTGGNGYNFLYGPGTADTTGSNGVDGNVAIWGPNNGSSNGLPATSPAGGFFVGSDPSFDTGPIQQTIHGLTPGNKYAVSFWWAGAQQAGFDGPTTEFWQVSFGSETLDTPTVHNSSHGFTGWTLETLDFTADNSSDLLSFLAGGGPSGTQPPFVLLDGVSVTPLTVVPEPSTLLLTGMGLLGLGIVYLRQRRARLAAV